MLLLKIIAPTKPTVRIESWLSRKRQASFGGSSNHCGRVILYLLDDTLTKKALSL